MQRVFRIATVIGAFFSCGFELASAINITVDYRYDTNEFFDATTTDGQQARAALEAVAARYSEIITTSLGAVALNDDSLDARIGFTHPGNGNSWDVSPATSQSTDSLAGSAVAEEYRGPWSIAQDEWILYAGGRSIGSAGVGGTGTGLNYTTVFNDGNSVQNRGFRTTGSSSNLPVWGGAITFDNDGGVNWHFDLTTAAPLGTTDFYSIALHEVGHALGLSTSWKEWTDHSSGGFFSGSNAVAAYNADNNTTLTSLEEVSTTNHHWEDGIYESKIFANGSPNTVGTVGLGTPQDLLMEPTANFIYPSLRRFELTNVDVAALADIGWSVISSLPTDPADFDEDGDVDGYDLAIFETNYGLNDLADADGDNDSDAFDFFIWQQHYTGNLSPTVAAVPEPMGAVMSLLGLASCVVFRRR